MQTCIRYEVTRVTEPWQMSGGSGLVNPEGEISMAMSGLAMKSLSWAISLILVQTD